jgi:hypothetical protein
MKNAIIIVGCIYEKIRLKEYFVREQGKHKLHFIVKRYVLEPFI